MSPALEGNGSRGTRQISPVISIQIQTTNSSFGGKTRMECESHADTSVVVVGKDCLIVHDFERLVKVSGHDSKDGAKNITQSLALWRTTARKLVRQTCWW